MSSRAKNQLERLVAMADIKFNGTRPWDIKVNDERFYRRVLSGGSLGFGESYMDGWWDCQALDELVTKILAARLDENVLLNLAMIKLVAKYYLANLQTTRKAARNAKHHYNIGNDLYQRMLGQRMVYSCGYWKNAKNLDEAQTAKLDLICRKLQLKPGMTLLDIGCGWGGFAQFAAAEYGVKVTGITPADEQVTIAKQRTQGLDVKILQKDYREIGGKYDRLTSIGMLEHVGDKNYKSFFAVCTKLLEDDGLMLHHTIGGMRAAYSDPWVDKYIFPGGVIPSLGQIGKAVERSLIIEDVHNFGPDYDKTLMAWHTNFVKHYPEIKDHYDERFYRMWTFYLLAFAGNFRSRGLQLYQIVFTKNRPSLTYQSVR